MTLDELGAHYARLRQELSDAYAAPNWSGELIDRLAAEISAVERALAGSAWGAPPAGLEPTPTR